jgi:very-short-patch-repair endonuclease
MNKISKTEDRLYEAMLSIGLKPERQYPISKMKVDFAFLKEKLVIEVDGWEYHKNRKQREIDEKRRDIAENLGWKVKRFTAEEVYENSEKIAWRIYQILGKSKNNKRLSDFEKKEISPIKESKKISPYLLYEQDKVAKEGKNLISPSKSKIIWNIPLEVNKNFDKKIGKKSVKNEERERLERHENKKKEFEERHGKERKKKLKQFKKLQSQRYLAEKKEVEERHRRREEKRK